jgi:hypothetical protein
MPTAYNEPGWTYNQPTATYNGVIPLVVQTIGLRARISRQQGWPVLDPTDPGYSLFVATQLQMRSRIHSSLAFGVQSQQMRANIRLGGTNSLQIRARVVKAQTLSMQARISGRKLTAAHFTYDVESTQREHIRVVFNVPGWLSGQSIALQARIAGVYSKKMTGFFLVSSTPGTVNGVQTFEFTSSDQTTRPLMMRAFIQK